MPRKVTVAQLRKRAAKAKIKGRTKMNRAQLERALMKDNGPDRKSITRQNTGRPINRRRQMSEEYEGYASYGAWWLALQMDNDYDLYQYFKDLKEVRGLIENWWDLKEQWELYLEIIEENEEGGNCAETPFIFDMARAFLSTISDRGWRDVYANFIAE